MKLKNALYALVATTALISAPAYADHYEIDKEHSHIAFLVGHLGFSQMLGEFNEFSGTFDFDQAHPENSKVDVVIKPGSVRTSSAALDEHLKGDKFFNVAKFPEAHFVSTKVRHDAGNDAEVTGNLTLLGVTKPVTLVMHFNKADYHPMTGMYIAGFDGRAILKRSEFGMGAYVGMIDDDVKLAIAVEGINQDRKKADALKKH